LVNQKNTQRNIFDFQLHNHVQRMDKELEKLAPSKRLAAKTMFATFKI